MRKFKELNVWKEGIELVKMVYKATGSFPKEEIYALTSQVKRSSVSLPSNIAEGAGRNTDKEFNNFLGIANGSCCELETQIIIAHELAFISHENFDLISQNLIHIQKMIFNLQKSLLL
ncbi:MAG TPA: four helix bundle protein [Chitinophagales bacterium]|nr:four helix bundle protein [Chitinophagales bacterium]